MRLTIDDRERNVELFQWLDRLAAGQWRKERLTAGDIRIDTDVPVIVERKTMNDFAISLIQGRLFSQASRLMRSYSQRFLILEGENCESQIDGRSLRGAEIAIIAKFGIPILKTQCPKETVETCCYLARQLTRQVTLPYFAGYRPKSRRQRQLKLLQQLPGVGPHRAQRLLDHFGSVRSVMNASPHELAAIDKIGKATANGINDTISEPEQHFLSWLQTPRLSRDGTRIDLSQNLSEISP